MPHLREGPVAPITRVKYRHPATQTRQRPQRRDISDDDAITHNAIRLSVTPQAIRCETYSFAGGIFRFELPPLPEPPPPLLFSTPALRKNIEIISTGIGKTTVLFRSEAISVSVCR